MSDEQAEGPVSRAVSAREPFGPVERLAHDRLVIEQRTSLTSARRNYSGSARVLFALMDRIYGKPRTLRKFRVLELVARVPYQAWENVAYVAVTHTSSRPRLARHVFQRVRASRFEQDNEQWHLLILEEMLQDENESFVRDRVIPQLLAFAYYQLSWFMFALRPVWSYRLNADFEDHAEHEYALLIDEHPEWEETPFESEVVTEYGTYDSLADLFRQICYDERLHRIESEVRMRHPQLDD
jgi:ubiquinol oxidase